MLMILWYKQIKNFNDTTKIVFFKHLVLRKCTKHLKNLIARALQKKFSRKTWFFRVTPISFQTVEMTHELMPHACLV